MTTEESINCANKIVQELVEKKATIADARFVLERVMVALDDALVCPAPCEVSHSRGRSIIVRV